MFVLIFLLFHTCRRIKFWSFLIKATTSQQINQKVLDVIAAGPSVSEPLETAKINAVFIKICWFFANISKNKTPVASKLSPIDSKLDFMYRMFKVIDLPKKLDF